MDTGSIFILDEVISHMLGGCDELCRDFDTLVVMETQNLLNNLIFGEVMKKAAYRERVIDNFLKITANAVYEVHFDYEKRLELMQGNARFKRIDRKIERALNYMALKNNIFSYRQIRPSYRKYFYQTLSSVAREDDLRDSDKLNGRRLLVLDNTVESRRATLSGSAYALNDTFAPESVTFLTVFTPLDDPQEEIRADLAEVLEYEDYGG